MAQPPAHRFGQIIGAVVEQSLFAPLQHMAIKHGLYLDFQHPRAARGGKSKVGWRDSKRNLHDLDYVLEAGGSEEVLGRPKAFVEIAYRRYTKHSRNKAQEMQGAIMPLAETYSADRPFLGVVLAGVFTEGSVAQLRSHGFGVLYFPNVSIVKAFSVAGIDAAFDESTKDSDIRRRVRIWDKLRDSERNKIVEKLRAIHSAEIKAFLRELEATLTRAIETIFIFPLHGRQQTAATVADAIRLVTDYNEKAPASGFSRYELNVRYTKGDEIRGSFNAKQDAIGFLKEFG